MAIRKGLQPLGPRTSVLAARESYDIGVRALLIDSSF